METSVKKLGFHRPGLPPAVNFPVCLAPMVGLSHCALRQLIREYMPQGAVGLWPSEMLNSRRLPDENLDRIPEAKKYGDETFWVPQILANEEDKIRRSLEKLYDYGAHGVDINMGCPVRKALKHNYGVALMGDPDYAAKVVEMTVAHSTGPVSVKLRGVASEDKDKWLDFVRGLEGAGADWLCLHPRTPEQKRKGRADWSQFHQLREHVNLPIIGNGDIQTWEDVVRLLEEESCDMVMVGRALTARPWLMWQVGYHLGWPAPEGRSGPPPLTPQEEGLEYGRSLLRLLDLMETVFEERAALRKFVFYLQTSGVWLPFGHNLYSRLTRPKTFIGVRQVLTDFFASPHSLYARTELRQ